jgi:hypothetical protein
MWLAPYGTPSYMREMRDLVRLHDGYEFNLEGTSKNTSYSSDATKLSANDSASFPFRFIDVHAGTARDPYREQFFEVPSNISAITGKPFPIVESGSREFGDLFSSALEELLGPRRRPEDPLLDRHRDIARSVQAIYEKAFF